VCRAWRRLAVRLHAWTGLLVAPLIVVVGLSGAALVFRPELDGLPSGSRPLAAPVAPPSLDAVLRAALLPHPGGEARALRIAADARRPYRVEVVRGSARIDVDVDPATLRVVGSRSPERSVFAAVHALHAGFHAGRAGAVVVGLLGVWLVVEGVSGLWLYGPSVTPTARMRRRGSSRAVHRLVGAASLAGGVLLGVTGAALALGSALAGSGSISALSRPGGLERLDAVAARVEAASPGARVVAIAAERDGGLRDDVRTGAGGDARRIRIDRTSGAVSAVGAAPWDLLRRLHAGDFAGWPSRAFYAAIGLALAVLAMTGFVIAARRHSSKVLM
jgi:vanillate O-demethylase ferredoxin subunit